MQSDSFSQRSTIRSIANVLASTDLPGLSGSQIDELLLDIGAPPRVAGSKREGLFGALTEGMSAAQAGQLTREFITTAMSPARHTTDRQRWNDLRRLLNKVLATEGWHIDDAGELTQLAEAARTFDDIERLTSSLVEEHQRRGTHERLMEYCSQELIAESLFHAISEAAKFGEGSVAKQGAASIYGSVGEVVDGYVRVDNITDEIKALYRDALGSDITGDDIFHFVYGKLHDPGYRTKYAADLKKMLPHIETPSSRAEFDKFAAAGQELMDLHVNYESVEPWPLDIQVKGDESDRETWRVLKMKWAKRKDPETGKNVNDVTKLIYNKRVTISGIPAEADEYMLGSRSAVAWLIDRYQVKKDKASGIVNDPNDWADEVGNPRYIVDLIGKVVRVAMETVRIVDGLGSE